MTVNAVPYVEQALSHPADNFRRALSFVGLGQQGVRREGGSDLAVAQNGSPNMSVNVAAGQALIAGTQNTTSQGSYHLLNDATVNLAIAAADPTNPRIDIVCASIQDAAYSGGSNQALVQVVTGTPAPSPSPPATPANSMVLAQVAVAALATSITNGNITDKRLFMSTLHRIYVFQSALQVIANATFINMPFDQIDYDPDGAWDNVNRRYTAQATGRYLVVGLVAYASGVTRAICSIGKNSTAEYDRLADSGPQGAAGATIISLVSGDQLYPLVWQNSGGNANTATGRNGAHFGVHLLN